MINMLFSFGREYQLQWHIFMHGVLAVTVSMIRVVEPYISKTDSLFEVFVCLSLTCTVHIVSLAERDDSDALVVLFLLCFLAPLVALAVLKRAKIARRLKDSRKLADDKVHAAQKSTGRCCRRAISVVQEASVVGKRPPTPPALVDRFRGWAGELDKKFRKWVEREPVLPPAPDPNVPPDWRPSGVDPLRSVLIRGPSDASFEQVRAVGSMCLT